MSFASAEKMFWSIVDSEDEEIREWVEAWHPCYADPEYLEIDEWAIEVNAALRGFGYEPMTKIKVSHARMVSLAIEAAAMADVSAAAKVFIFSAAPGGCHAKWQNPLRALSVIRNLPTHRFRGDVTCEICGEPKESPWQPLEAAARFASGYTGEETDILDNLMIVRWFNRTQHPETRPKDLTAFRRVLKIIAGAPPTDTSVKIAKSLKKQFRDHEDHWRYFFEALGYAGVLKTDVQPGYLQSWTNTIDRHDVGGRSEVPPPCCFWRRWMGFDPQVFDKLFPQIKLPPSLRPGAKPR